VPLGRVVRRDEKLDLHLLELAGAEDEVPGGDLVPERLPDLGDPERGLLPAELEDVLEVDEDPLRGLRAQVDLHPGLLGGAHQGLEHEVELARLGELAAALRAADLALCVLGAELLLAEVVLAPAPLTLAQALDEGIGEALEVARGLPDSRVHQDRGVEGDHVVALLQHRPPPLGLDVVLQQDAVVAVVIGRRHPTVDLRGLEDEAPPLAEGDDLVERDFGLVRGFGGHLRLRLAGCPARMA
jgi:hypothetical protein